MSRLTKVREQFISLPLSTHLAFSAIISGLIYLFIFSLPFPLVTFYKAIPPVDYTKLTNYSPGGFLAYIFGIGALFGLYYWVVRLPILIRIDQAEPPGPGRVTKDASAILRFIFGASIILALILLFSYPLTAIDLFIYAIRSRGWAVYNLQPLSTPPEALPSSDPWLGLAGEWVDAASPYGPLWEWLSLAGFYLSDGNFLGHLLALKAIGLLAYLGCSGLVYLTLKDYRPNWALVGVIAFAWNPLVLLESVQNGHNDIVMVFFLLVAAWLFRHRIHIGSKHQALFLDLLICFSLALSVLVKFVTVMIIPFFVLGLAVRQPGWFRRVGALILYSLITMALVFIPMWPVWPGWDRWALLEAGRGAGRSLLALLVLGLRGWLGTNTAFDLSRNLIFFAFGLIYLYYLWRTFNALQRISWSFASSQEIEDVAWEAVISATFFTLFWYVLIAAPVFHAWYILWFLPLGSLLLPQQRPLIGAIVFSISALLIIPYFETLRVWYPMLLRNHFLGHLIGLPLLILPPALALLYSTGSTPDSKGEQERKT